MEDPKAGEIIRLEVGSEERDSIDVDSFKPTGRTVTKIDVIENDQSLMKCYL